MFRDRTTGGAFIDALVNYITGGAVAGDYNGNGVVDAADYVVWRDSLGGTSLTNEGAGVSPGVVNQADYDFWKSRFGSTSGSGAGSGTQAAVPEPSTIVLVLGLFAGVAFGTRRI